jgi:hypothetical protein
MSEDPPKEPAEKIPMSEEVAEEIQIQSQIAGGHLHRYQEGRKGFVPPNKHNFKDRIEASRILHEEKEVENSNELEDDSQDSE